MFGKLMRLQVHLRGENHELLLLAFAIWAEEMIIPEMLLEGIVVLVVVWLSWVLTVAEETSLVFVSAVLIELVTVVEAWSTEGAYRVALEAGLVNSSRSVIAVAHVLLQLLVGKQLVLMSKDLLIPGAQVAHLLVMGAAYMSMQIRPT
jgi:hypothetical protein